MPFPDDVSGILERKLTAEQGCYYAHDLMLMLHSDYHRRFAADACCPGIIMKSSLFHSPSCFTSQIIWSLYLFSPSIYHNFYKFKDDKFPHETWNSLPFLLFDKS